VEKRQEAVARTMEYLRQTHTSSETFAHRKQDEKALEATFAFYGFAHPGGQPSMLGEERRAQVAAFL
jgi:hypothetical protein